MQFGADAIKVEGAEVPRWQPQLPPLTKVGDWINHQYLNVGTRSLTVDIRSDAWPEVVEGVAGVRGVFDEVHLVRHGESEWNRCGRWQGQLDSPLTPRA